MFSISIKNQCQDFQDFDKSYDNEILVFGHPGWAEKESISKYSTHSLVVNYLPEIKERVDLSLLLTILNLFFQKLIANISLCIHVADLACNVILPNTHIQGKRITFLATWHLKILIKKFTSYRSRKVNLKSFVGKGLLWIKWKFELTYAL